MKILLHICCGPCSVYPVDILQEEKIEFEGFFYNPNIHPIEEFNKRKEHAIKVSTLKLFPLHYVDDFEQETWEDFKGSEEQRCAMCYGMRFEKAAIFAKDNGFDAFTTTLLVSPYQKHDLIRELGEKYAKRQGIDFFYRDFRPGFRQGQQQAKEMELYRQKFCGCILSKNK